ncbi:MAG: ATP-binding cassette domain-containing protein [Sulfurovum sp.]|nr:ATP-binding cassette domain-containing protein [Sulfurovum sp.]
MTRIKFENVSKHYRLINSGGIKTFLFNFVSQIKSYRKNVFHALEDISFEIKDKEVVGIIGRNGAGKSTTLGLIAGVLSPTSGNVEVKGRIAPLLELGAGFHHDLTGRENIVLNGLLLGMSKKDIVSKVDEIIEFSELEEFIDQPIRMYSSGMLSRLGFSIAIQTNPEILLIDEVLSVGDKGFQKKSADKIHEFREKGITIVFVSHDVGTVEKLCDKVIWIENHKIKMIGNAKDVISAYTDE